MIVEVFAGRSPDEARVAVYLIIGTRTVRGRDRGQRRWGPYVMWRERYSEGVQLRQTTRRLSDSLRSRLA